MLGMMLPIAGRAFKSANASALLECVIMLLPESH
ncbi:hypothetical protein LINGRAHAP2_LOCUS6321 [Linum grandiflorum]